MATLAVANRAIGGLEARLDGKGSAQISQIQLNPIHISVLRAVASLDYKGNYLDRAKEVLGEVTTINFVYRALGVFDIFSAVTAALNRGVLFLDELVGDRTQDLKFVIWRLTDLERNVLTASYNLATRNGEAAQKQVAEELDRIKGSIRQAVSRIYAMTGFVQNLAQLAVLAYASVKASLAYAPLKARLEEGLPSGLALTPQQYAAVKAAASLNYNLPHFTSRVRETVKSKGTAVVHNAFERLGVKDTFSAVVRALHREIYTVDELAGEKASDLKARIEVLTDFERTVLSAIHNTALQTGSANYAGVASQANLTERGIKNAVTKVYSKFKGIVHNQAQLAVLAYAMMRSQTLPVAAAATSGALNRNI